MKYNKYAILARVRYRKFIHSVQSHSAVKGVRHGWARLPRFGRVLMVILTVVVVVAIGWLSDYHGVAAQTVTLTKDDYLGGTSRFGTIQIGDKGTSMQLQQGVVGKWNSDTNTELQLPPSISYGVTNLVYGPNDTLYSLTSLAGQCHFNRYDIALQSWKPLNTPPIACGTGTILVFDGVSSFYYAPGGSASVPSNRFFRYDIKSDSWDELENVPSTISNISDGVFVSQGSNEYVYLFRGMSSPSFWRYSVKQGIWESMSPFPTASSVAAGITLAWDGATTLYAVANGSSGEFRKYDIVTGVWTSLTNLTGTNYYDRYSLKIAGGKIYALKLIYSIERVVLRSYTIATNTWVTLPTPATSAQYYDNQLPLAYDGSRYLYTYIASGVHPHFARYDTINASWNNASLFRPDQDDSSRHLRLMYDGSQSVYYFAGREGAYDRVYKYDLGTRQTMQVGSQISALVGYTGVYNNSSLYVMPLSGGTVFRKYDTVTNTFTDLASLPLIAYDGMDILDGGDGYLYTVFGGGQNRFYRYNISLNSWQPLSSLPQVESAGGGLARVGRKIYALSGSQTSFLQAYNMDTSTWTALTGVPSGSIDYGGFVVSDQARYLYIGMSNRTSATTRKVYRYDTTTAAWQRIADLPADALPTASGFYDTTNNKLYVAQGGYSAFIWDWSPDANSYVSNGVWYSKTYDLHQVETWTSLDSTVTGTGTVLFETRSSADGNLWSQWQAVNGTAIASPVNRYLQLKVTLSGNTSSTPTVKNIAVHHTQETTAPTVPSQFSAHSKKDGDVLTTGQTYEHQHPYFSWTGASDGTNGSGVDGYYVYFGIDSNADPEVDGSYQTEQDYTATLAMTAGEVYYVRIKVKDTLGNVSPAATYFSYRYFYISPPGAVVKTSSSDFSEGVNTNVAIDNGTMHLQNSTNGAWSTGGIAMPPEYTYGASQEVVGDYIYAARGTGTKDFWRYNLVSNTWSSLAQVPTNVSTGSSLAWDGGNGLYLSAGNGTNFFYKYDIENDIWTELPKLPVVAQGGTDIAYIGNGQFAIMFAVVREFYIYDSSDGQYTAKQAYPTSIDYGGSGLWYDGDDTVYAYFGSWNWGNFNGSSRISMAKYSISNDSWRDLAAPPVISVYTQNNLVGDGRGGLYVFTNGVSDNLNKRQRTMRYDMAKNSWSEVHGLEGQIYWGSAASDNTRFIYVLPGSNGTTQRKIYRYDTWEHKFTPSTKSIDVMDRIPYDSPTNAWVWNSGNATTAVYDGSKYIYAIGGSESSSSWSRFVKFDHLTGETIYLPPPPLIGVGGSLGYVGGELFYLPGKSTRDFYKYDETLAQWVRMSDVPSVAYRPGPTSLVKVGGVLYAALGNGRVYYKYTPDSGGGTWLRMTDSPGTILNGSMAYSESENAIYVLAGNSSRSLYRYDVIANSWTTKALLPLASAYGSTMVVNGTKIYIQLGNITKNSYVYDIAADSWLDAGYAPETFRYGATMMKISNTYAVAFSGESTPDIWQFVFPSATTAYNGQATHISQPFVTTGIFDYAGITAQVNLPAGTSIELWTRSSDDGTNWGDWMIADNVKRYQMSISARVSSPPKLYTQVKTVLQSDDNIFTPTVDSYSIQYYYDIDPPTNPTVTTVYTDSTKTVEVNNNTWYKHNKPLIDWPDPGQPGGATDGPLGSNIAGYWVYFGTDSTASPRTAGTFVPQTQYEADLTQPGNYYLRVQVQDVTGNVDGAIYAPFVYKFDNQSPTNPSLVTVTPSGFTTHDNFTFEWPNAYDAHSGVAGYCYHTGAMSGPFAAEICQPGKILEDVSAAYRTGTNVFYVRAYDIAGNYSPYYTSASYYYTTDPPGPVTNLRAVPPTSAQNMFAFAWELPVLFSGDPDLLTYCYSINILPSPLNTTCTSDLFISAFKAATQQGTNVIYVVAKDEAGNANWNDYASSNFIANTVSPGIPLNLVVTDTSDRVSNRWSLTSTWDAPIFVGNGIKAYVVERSEDGHTFTEIGNTSTRAFVDLDVQPEATYYYRVRAADNVDNRGGASGIVARSALGSFATPPKIVVHPEAKVGFDQAKISWATSREATSFVYYGVSPSDLGQSKGSLGTMTDHDQTITGLQPSTTYYYRVQSFDNARSYQLNDAYSSIYSFRTTEAARMYDVAVSDLTTGSALVSWKSSVPTKVKVEYGTTLGYGLVVDDESSGYSIHHSMKLTGLPSGTLHHLRIVSTTEFGSQLSSDDYTFETIARPTIDTIRFQPITDETSAAVRVSWKTNVPTSSTVRYSALGDRLESSLSELTTNHEVILRNLASSTQYTVMAEGRDQYGNLVSSPVQNWQSQLDTRPPVVSDTSLSVTVTETAKGKRAQLIAIWKTDEPSTSQVVYGKMASKTLESKTPLDTEPTASHVVIISDLNLADIYKVQTVSRDLNGNTVYAPVTTIVTPDKEVNVFDNVLNLMLRLFRF